VPWLPASLSSTPEQVQELRSSSTLGQVQGHRCSTAQGPAQCSTPRRRLVCSTARPRRCSTQRVHRSCSTPPPARFPSSSTAQVCPPVRATARWQRPATPARALTQQLPKQLLAIRPSGSQQPRWLPSPARDTRLVAPTSFFNSPNFPQTSPTARPAIAAPLQRTCPVLCAPGPSARARPCALGPSACTSCPCAPWSSAPRTPQWPCRDLQ